LRPSDIEALIVARRGAGSSASTVRTIYTVPRAALGIAVRDGCSVAIRGDRLDGPFRLMLADSSHGLLPT
jgi:hypothetical protein